MRESRILAIDYGAKNVGLACSEESGIVLHPLPSLPHHSRRRLVSELRAVVEQRSITSIVVGMPWNMDGTAGPAAKRVADFSRLLARSFDLPLTMVDERLTSVEAAELWRNMNRRQRRKYRTSDSLAAALILQRFIEES